MYSIREWDPARAGDYQLLCRLGAGGMGEVFLGRAPDNHLAAVKVVHEAFAGDPEFRARFRREVAAARRVNGPWAAPVIDADPDARQPWLATEYVAGPTLAAAVAEHGVLPEPTIRMVAARLAQALVAIHSAGLVHRDLKPSNVLLAGDGPRVIDFGIARALDTTKVTLTGRVVGTPAFMAPEQVTESEVGSAADVFCLGSLLYFAATGGSPFGDASTVATLRRVVAAEPDLAPLSPGVRDVVGRCLVKDPSERATAGQLVAMLLEDAPTLAGGSWLPPAFATLVELEKSALEHTLVEHPPAPAFEAASEARSEATTEAAVAAPPATPDLAQPTGSRRRVNVLLLAAGAVVIGLVTVLIATFGLSGGPGSSSSAAATTSTTSTPDGPNPTPVAPSSPPPVHRIEVGMIPSVVPGWIAQVSDHRNAAFDVPADWSVAPPGRIVGSEPPNGQKLEFRGVAEHGAVRCPGEDEPVPDAMAGIGGSDRSNTAAAARERAERWAEAVYEVNGALPEVVLGDTRRITVHGRQGSHVTATVTRPPGGCGSSNAVVHVVALPADRGETLLWVLHADVGVVADADIERMITTIRPAGMPQKCSPRSELPGRWC